jgi:hypothetical protein
VISLSGQGLFDAFELGENNIGADLIAKSSNIHDDYCVVSASCCKKGRLDKVDEERKEIFAP